MHEILALALAGFLLVVGATHFVVPGYYDRLVPTWLPGTRAWVLVSGATEIILGVGLVLAHTRPLAAWIVTGLMALYVATHVDALIRAHRTAERWLDRPTGAVVRVTVNLAYLLWAVAVALTADRSNLVVLTARMAESASNA